MTVVEDSGPPTGELSKEYRPSSPKNFHFRPRGFTPFELRDKHVLKFSPRIYSNGEFSFVVPNLGGNYQKLKDPFVEAEKGRPTPEGPIYQVNGAFPLSFLSPRNYFSSTSFPCVLLTSRKVW